ncbi:hypothetical protein OF83DRAFT_1071533 [Amylostereum chailletii]|nr:hypothetical protein OF83DRAFT_1071533 [Amylostereum chailletii]
MLQELDVVLPEEAVGGSTTRVRCICHVFNLTVKAILGKFTRKRTPKQIVAAKNGATEPESDEEEDDNNKMPELEEVDDDDDDEEDDEARCAYDEAEISAVEAEVAKTLKASPHDQRTGRSALKKVTKLATRVHFSPTLRAALLALCAKHRTAEKIILRPVATRWNSVSVMIGSALDIQVPINSLVVQDKYKLKACVLRNDEWSMLKQLYPILQRFLLATKHMEQMGKPLLFQVIPAIDTLTSHLEDTASDMSLNILIRASALSGAKILHKYYSKTDESIMYRMAMSM